MEFQRISKHFQAFPLISKGIPRISKALGGPWNPLLDDLGATLGSLLGDFGVILGSLLDDFRMTLGLLLADFGTTLGSLSDDFGTTLGSSFGLLRLRMDFQADSKGFQADSKGFPRISRALGGPWNPLLDDLGGDFGITFG